jgi:uncharacterized protein (TIGR00251 family)
MALSTRLQVRVSPGARASTIVGRHGDGWKVRVAAAPEDGQANEALVRLLSERLAIPRASVQLVSGRRSRDKIVSLTGIDAAETERRLGRPQED